jgi:hypothetical protein
MRSDAIAIVWHRTIHLHGCTSAKFMSNTNWLTHELVHIEQYRRLGTIGFISRYLWYSIKHGYYQNPLEIEAFTRESETSLVASYQQVTKRYWF